MSPSNGKNTQPASESTDEESADNAHGDFMRSSRMLIEVTKNKIGRIQVLSDELNELASLITDDREELRKTRMEKKLAAEKEQQKVTTNSTKQTTANVSGSKAISDKAKKKDGKKSTNRAKKISERRRFKVIEYTLQKVKEADARDRDGANNIYGPPPNSARSDLSALIEETRIAQQNSDVDSKNESCHQDHATTCGARHCQCREITDIYNNEKRSQLSRDSKRHSEIGCDIKHDDSQDSFRLPQIKSNQFSERNKGRQNKRHRQITSLVREEIRLHNEKINGSPRPIQREVTYLPDCVNRTGQSMYANKVVLTPNIINVQCLDNCLTKTALAPLSECKQGYRLKFGKIPVFPLNINLNIRQNQKHRAS